MVRNEFDAAVPADQLVELTPGARRIEPEEKRRRHRWHLRQAHPELAIEFRNGIFVPSDAVDIGNGHARLGKAPAERVTRQRRIVLDSCESFFLCRRNQPAVDQDAARRIVKMRGNADNDRITHSIP